MKTCTALLGAAALLWGAAPSQANVAVRSKVSFAFVISATVDRAGADSDTGIKKVRFGTKDLLAVLGDSNSQPGLRTLLFTRTTDTADDTPPTAVLSNQPTVLDRSGTVVPAALTNLTISAPFDLDTGLGTSLLNQSVARISDEAAGGTDVKSRKDVASEGATWTFDGATDDFVLDLLSINTITSKRRTLEGADQGLFLRSRTAKVHGGADVAFTLGTGHVVDFTGVLTGTLKVTGEKP